jgi:hypothetical protein
MEDRKRSHSLLSPLERRLSDFLVSLVPRAVASQHLTLLTLLWSVLVIGAGILARRDLRWLYGISALIVLQYLTDAVDGKVGKTRNAGLVAWGYYMDHLLDYVFLCALLGVYAMLLPSSLRHLMVIALAVAGGFMVSSFLARAMTGELQISYGGVGPIEVRLLFIALNTWLVVTGRTYMLAVIPYAIAVSIVVLAALIWRTQRELWRLDDARRRRQVEAAAASATNAADGRS